MFNSLLSILMSVATVLSSPDGKINVQLSTTEDQGLRYSITYDSRPILSPSGLGLKTNDADYTRLEFLSADSKQIEVNYSMTRIKAGKIEKSATSAIAHFKTPEGRLLDIEWYISNTDVAFRYLLPKDSKIGSIRVLSEETYFDFPEGTTTFLCPQSDAMVGWQRSKPSYEEYYKCDAPLDRPSEFGHGYTFPCLFKIGDAGWALVSETGVDSRYCASRLGDYTKGKGYQLCFPMPEENNGNGTVEPAFGLPGVTPWRTISLGGDLAPIVESTVAFDVVEPKYEASKDYKFGKSTWSWIVWQDASMNEADQNAYIDLASAMHFPYILIDAGWDQNIGRKRIGEMAEQARRKNVEFFLWYSSSGWWNDIVQSPVNVMCEPIQRKAEMRWLQSIGARGIKVDFFGGDKQETMRLYESILSDANDFGLMVIFHGCTIPRGWERMYPNYVGSEAVRASENLVFMQAECDQESQAASLHPYIRNAVGCMEFGGTFLNKRLTRANGKPNADGRVWGSIRRTTDAFELATAVLFQNPIQNFAITPNNLEDAPAEAIDFLKEVPTTWDETRYVKGYPGKSAVVARRHGDTWYIGAVCGSEDGAIELDINALQARFGGSPYVLATGKAGALEVVEKHKKPLQITKDDGVVVVLRPSGR